MKKNLFRKWAINCALGELLGIGIAGTIAVVVNYYIGEPQSVTKRITVLLIMLGAGAIEGTSIAIFQWKILHRLFPSMKFVSWWRWTAFIALLGWGTGMLPSLFFIKPSSANNTVPSVGIIAVIAACSGAVAGAMLGLFDSKRSNRHFIDAVDEVIERVLVNNGQVAFADEPVLKDYQHIALIYH